MPAITRIANRFEKNNKHVLCDETCTGGRPANVTNRSLENWQLSKRTPSLDPIREMSDLQYLDGTKFRIPVPKGYCTGGYGKTTKYDNSAYYYCSYDSESDVSSDEKDDLGCLFHHVSVCKDDIVLPVSIVEDESRMHQTCISISSFYADYPDVVLSEDFEEHKRKTLELACVQYEDDKKVDFRREYAHVLGDFSVEFCKVRSLNDKYMKTQAESYDFGVFGKIHTGLIHLEAPCIPFLAMDHPNDYDKYLETLYRRYPSLKHNNIMSYINYCHVTVSRLIQNGYFDLGKDKFIKVAPRVLEAIRATGRVPQPGTMIRSNWQKWIKGNLLPKTDKVGEFLWSYLFHFDLMYHPDMKNHKRYKLFVLTAVKERVDSARGHMMNSLIGENFLDNAIKGIKPESYDCVAQGLIASFTKALGDMIGIPEKYKNIASTVMTVVGGTLGVCIMLYVVRFFLGEAHAFVCFLKQSMFPHVTNKQWKQTDSSPGDEYAEGHMYENNWAPLVTRFGIMAVQAIACCPTNAREVSDAMRTLTYGSSLIETILKNAEPLVRLMVSKITGDLSWIGTDMDDDIVEHLRDVEKLRSEPRLVSRLSNDIQLNHQVRKLYKWQMKNASSLRSAGIREPTMGAQISRAERNLREWFERCTNVGDMSDARIVPVCILLSGKTNQGKTAMLSAVVRIVHAWYKKRGKYVNDVNGFFSKAKDSTYWDGYNHQIAYLIDEFLCSSQPEDRSAQLNEIVGIVNHGVYPCNYADCASKGTDNFDSPLVLLTTNFSEWKQLQMTDPRAFFKRAHFPLELRRGLTVTSSSEIFKAWEVTVTNHAFQNQDMYEGTPQALWDACVVNSERVWIPFGQLMGIILSVYIERENAKPLMNHMGDVGAFCDTYFGDYFMDADKIITKESTFVYEDYMFDSFSERTEEDSDEGSHMADYEELTNSSMLDDDNATGHMFHPFFGFSPWEPTPPIIKKVSPCAFVSPSFGVLLSSVSCKYVDADQFLFALMDLVRALHASVERLDEIFPECYSIVDKLTSCISLEKNFRVLRNDLRYRQVFFKIMVQLCSQHEEWFAQHFEMLTNAINSGDISAIVAIYPDAFALLCKSSRKSLGPFNTGMYSIAPDDYTDLIDMVRMRAPPKQLARSFWNIGNLVHDQRRARGDHDLCSSIGDVHYCGMFFSDKRTHTSRVVRTMYDLSSAIVIFCKYLGSSAVILGNAMLAGVYSAANEVVRFFTHNQAVLKLCAVTIVGLIGGAAVGALVARAINHMLNSVGMGQSEHQKNPMFMRKGRTKDVATKYTAKGQSAESDRHLSAITTRNTITRHFTFFFEDGDQVSGKCVVLGKYIFMHSHVLWAFPAVKSLVINTNWPYQEGGSYEISPRDYVFHDYMNDPNARDMVRLTMTKNHCLGRKPGHYLVPRADWSKTLKKNLLVRVLGAGENRKHSLAHTVKSVFAIGRPFGTAISVNNVDIIKEHEAGYMAYDTPSLAGDCSDPYICDTKLMGLHVAYVTGDSVFMPIYLEDCPEDMGAGQMSYFPKMSASDLCMPNGVVPIGMLDRDYTGRPKDPYVSTIYGPKGTEGIGGFHPSTFPLNRVPAPLCGLEGQSPWNKHNLNYARTFSPSPPQEYEMRVRRDAVAYLDGFFTVPSTFRARRLSDDEVDNGIAGYLTAMDKSTSAGLLGKVHGVKRADMYLERDDGGWDPGPVLCDAADEIQNMIDHDTVPMIVCCENLKAETIPPDKLPRCFTSVSIEHIRWTKAVVGDALGYMKRHIVGSACAVGINPHSMQWNVLYEEVIDAFGPDGAIIAGDLSNCDLSCHPVFLDAIVGFLNTFYKYEEKSRSYKELRYCCLSFVHQQRVRGKRYFEIFRGHPSGHFMTTLFNCIVVYSIHRYAYEFLVDSHKYPWQDNVRLKVYGDDSLGCVHERVQKWYNMRTIQPVFTMFGMIYTDPGKLVNFPPFIPRDEAAFLGRGFRRTATVMNAPLNLDAIYGMIHWVRTEAMNVDEALDTNIRCALMEMYHHGQPAFEKFKAQLFIDGKKYNYISKSLIGVFTYKFFQDWHVSVYAGCDDARKFWSPDDMTDIFFA